MTNLIHHPLQSVGYEVHHLRDIEERGVEAETPLIAMAGMAMIVFPILLVVVGLAFGVAWLVTGAAI